MHKTIALLALLSANTLMAEPVELTADVWADNWFDFRVNGTKIFEDSVSITTERSFNAETFSFSAELPAVVAIVAKDFKENDTGLEYIGSRRQQMGDGGLILQINDRDTGDTVAVSNQAVRCMVLHHAPVDTACAELSEPEEGKGACASKVMEAPAGWMEADFDDSAWLAATEYTESEVSPKQGYDRIDWDPQAKLIWSGNLLQDNTLLCRLRVAR